MAHILLLEDDLVLADQLTQILEMNGHNVQVFSEADAAVEHFRTSETDLVIADIFIKKDGNFSPGGGVTLISSVRQLAGSPIPIIAISGAFATSDGGTERLDHAVTMRQTTKTVGATRNLAKPFDPRALLQMVDELLSS